MNGRVWGKGYAYNNLPEATAFNVNFAKVTTPENSEVKPTEVTLAQLSSNFDFYLNRMVKISDATVGAAVDVKYSAVTSAGNVTDGTNTFPFNFQSTGTFGKDESGKNKKIYMYVQAAKDSKVDVTCIPSVYKNTKQLNIWEQKWVKNK